MPNSRDLTLAIKTEALRLGFDLCRISTIGEAPHADFFDRWVSLERAGEMHYLTRNTEKRRNPKLLAEKSSVDNNIGYDQSTEFQSMIVLAVNHFQFPLSSAIMADPSRGIIASYAWGEDYHEIIRPALYELDAFIRAQSGRSVEGKCLVDTGPVLERDWAHRVGLGFTGKNCCTIHPKLGSWLLLATIFVPESLWPDQPLLSYPFECSIPNKYRLPTTVSPEAVANGLPPNQEYGRWEISLTATSDDSTPSRMVTCGRCTRCLDDCPTNAFVGPYHLDPQRCISYWTIEARGSIPRALRPHFGNRIFGCDICQEVCPWNQRLESHTPLMAGLVAQSDRIAPPLLEGFATNTPYWLNQEAFSKRFRRSPIKRAKRSGMLRNVCVALGNWADPKAVVALSSAMESPESISRSHAAWALGEIMAKHSVDTVRPTLEKAMAVEEVDWVQEEIHSALS